MGRVLLLIFVLIMGVALVGVDFVAMKKAQFGRQFGLRDYAHARSGGMTDALFPPRLIDMMPDRPTGWDSDELRRADAVRVLAGAQGNLSIDPVLIAAGADVAEHNYQYGDSTLLVRLAKLPMAAGEGDVQALFATAQANDNAPIFADLRGLVLVQQPQPGLAPVRVFHGVIGDQIYMQVFTNANDGAILSVMRGTDVAGLNAMLDSPIDGMGMGALVLGSDPNAGRQPAANDPLYIVKQEEEPATVDKKKVGTFGSDGCTKGTGGKVCSVAPAATTTP